MCEVMKVKKGEINKILSNESLKYETISIKKATVSNNIKATIVRKINECIK